MHCAQKGYIILWIFYIIGEKMMILGISGSPKNRGNTEFLLGQALKIATERGFRTEQLLCSRADVRYCTDCGECARGKPCPIDDDMLEYYDLFEEADGFIVATPVYFGSVSAQLKAVMDRTLPFRRQGLKLKDKAGCAIAIGGFRNGGQEKAIEVIHAWMHIQGMVVVGDNSHFGGAAVRPASEDRIGLQAVTSSASKLCDLLEKIGKRDSCWS
jgi:multimeric flavodoxin WrbA